MGFPNIYHIAPAVLYMNPGVNRDEYLSLLDKTHGSWDFHIGEDSKDIPLTYFDPTNDEKDFHTLDGLAKLLCLSYSDGFNDVFFKTRYDENGIPLNNIYYYPELSGPGTFTVYVHTGNSLGSPERFKFVYGRGIRTGFVSRLNQLLSDQDIPEYAQEDFEEKHDFAFIKEVHAKKFRGLEQGDDKKYPMYHYDVTLVPFKKDIRKEIYQSKDELYANWPVFSAEGMFDWSKERGNFTHRAGIFRDFMWYKKDDRYYLDERSFEVMSATDYRQLILTCEAIKKGAWKPLSYKGGMWWGQFLDEYPDVNQRFKYAGHAAQLSESAKNQCFTNNDFLRSMMLGDVFYNTFYDREIL